MPAVQCEREVARLRRVRFPLSGSTCASRCFAALSDSTSIAPANYGKKALRSLRNAQRDLLRKHRGSNNRRKVIRRLARLQQRVANARRDVLHQHSTTIAQDHGTVVVDALKVRTMSASAQGAAAAPGRNMWQKAELSHASVDQR